MSFEKSGACCQGGGALETRYTGEESRTPTTAVVEAVASAADTEPTSLPPLYESIDPEVLDRLFGEGSPTADASTVLGFTVEEWYVVVRGDGTITVCDECDITESPLLVEQE